MAAHGYQVVRPAPESMAKTSVEFAGASAREAELVARRWIRCLRAEGPHSGMVENGLAAFGH